MVGTRQQQASYYSDFYRNSYHKVMNVLIMLCFFILVLIAGIIYLVLFQAPVHYYATTLSGQIISMIPIS